MNRSEKIGKLAMALSKAQGAIASAVKDTTNPHFKTRYADLNSVREALRKPFADNNLAYTQFVRLSEKAVEIETLLMLGDSEEFVSETLAMPLGQMTPQAIGSAITYGRRYALQAMAGVTPDDDDGNAAEEGMRRAPSPPPQRTLPPQPREQSGLCKMLLIEIKALVSRKEAGEWANKNAVRKKELSEEEDFTVTEAFHRRVAELKSIETAAAAQPQPPKPMDFVDFEKLRERLIADLSVAGTPAAKNAVYEALIGPHEGSLLPPDLDDLRTLLRKSIATVQEHDEDGVVWDEADAQ